MRKEMGGGGGRDEGDGSGSRDIVSLIMSPWRMETRLRAKAPVDVFGRWPTRVRPHACHGGYAATRTP